MFKDVIKLISVTYTLNDYGEKIPTETSRTVFANRKSIRQSEFYQAQVTGLKPEIMFVIRLIDYDEEKLIEYNNKKYDIIRSYQKDEDFIELIAQGVEISE